MPAPYGHPGGMGRPAGPGPDAPVSGPPASLPAKPSLPTGPRGSQQALQHAPSGPAASRVSSVAEKTDAREPTKPVKASAGASQADAVTEQLGSLRVDGGANVPGAGLAASEQRRGDGARAVPGSGGRPRGNPTSVFDGPRGTTNGGAIEVPDSDFDFDASNAKFDKEGAAASPEKTNAAASVLDTIPPPNEDQTSFYDKSSFFDNISSEVRERHEIRAGHGGDVDYGRGGRGGPAPPGGFRGGGRGRADRMAEERRNMATFGEVGRDTGYGSRQGPWTGTEQGWGPWAWGRQRRTIRFDCVKSCNCMLPVSRITAMTSSFDTH